MCGICGFIQFDGDAARLTRLEPMLERLRRRGPDHSGAYADGPLAMGHRRLSIIDLSDRSNQPMLDVELGMALVFNGTIYNYRELRAELQGRGYRFFSEGDSEVILKAYHAWGDDCVTRLHGMFAFAVWNLRERTLFLARDRLGIKPLYHARSTNGFYFASSTQALLAADADIDRSIDAVALHYQFSLHAVVPAPHTLIQGIRKLPPAHTLTLSAKGDQRLRRYWQLSARRPERSLSEPEWLERIHEALREAVRKRNDVADVPVGVLLSGGLDSSLLVALLAEIGAPHIRSYSVGFEDAPEEAGSEFEYSDQVVERYATDHHKMVVPNSQVLQRLPEAVDAMAEPMFGQDAVAFYLLSEQVAKDIKVVQSGQGADEVFGGYFWYPRMRDDSDDDPLRRFSRHYFDRDHDEMGRLLAQPWVTRDFSGDLIRARLSEPDADDFMDQVLRLDVTTLIVDDPVKRVDNMTMAWGLEARVPFLDHQLVEVAAACPVDIKLREGGKYPLKAMARGLLPEAVIDRPKGYFPMPALKYVRGAFLEFMRDIVNSRSCRERGLYQRPYIDMLLAAPDMHHTRIMGNKLWHLAVMEYWLQRQLDPA